MIPIKQIFVSRIFLCAVINQVNISFRIESEAARLKSYLANKKKDYPRYVILLQFFFNILYFPIAKQYGVFELFPFCLLSLQTRDATLCSQP